MSKELGFEQLKKIFRPEDFSFLKSGVEKYDGLIGQERAGKAIDFGLNIKKEGYNIFVSGPVGSGKTATAIKFAEKIAKTEPTPKDICYVFNFENPKESKALLLEAGKAKILKEQMDELITRLSEELSKVYSCKDFEDKKTKILKDYQEKRDIIIKEITGRAKERNFGVKTTTSGMYFMPIVEGEIISEEQYDSLTEEEKEIISEISDEIQEEAAEVMREIKELEKKAKDSLEELEFSEGFFIVGNFIGFLMDVYIDNDEVLKYLNCVKEDILENMDAFMGEDSPEEEAAYSILPWYNKKSADEVFYKYKINVLVDNSGCVGAPVIIDYNPTYTNLVGEIEYDSEFGNLSTDFLKIKPGILHKANGGYLILQAYDVLTNSHSWETLRRIIKTGKLTVEPLREYSTGLVVSYIKPEAISINIKIILVGLEYYYEILENHDEEFKKLFKIKAEFDYEMSIEENNIRKIFGFIKNFSEKENTLHFDSDSIAKILEYSQRVAGSQKKFSTNFTEIEEVLTESITWAKMDNKKIVTSEYVEKALEERYYRFSMYEDKLNELMDDNIIMIDTFGKKVGQINGLAVIQTDNYEFGKPLKITATTSVGKSGVINIEKEADMSGNIHDKGVQVLSGYIEQTYSQNFSLSLSCRVCFEQNYNGIDGDSASSTELYAILSSLSSIPINQEIAVTGSINQFGEIQPIGGVTHKIEGFFDLCKKRGLTGNQGVIIPEQNIFDLVLKNEVIEAVKEGKFHIYHVSHIDEGIEILTGVKAGVLDSDGKYPEDTVHGRAYKKLYDFHKATLE